jgi:DnaJ-class molecular chaperone
MGARNFYVVLGIPTESTPERIRSAYRALAKRWHPDRSGPGGTSRFREISDAYRVLSDPASRRAHDRVLQIREPEARVGGSPPLRRSGEGWAEPLSPGRAVHRSPPFREPAFGYPPPEPLGTRATSTSARARHFEVEVVLSRAEAVAGGILPLLVPGHDPCRRCAGDGQDWLGPCRTCGGAGRVALRRPVAVRIPAMVRDGAGWDVPLHELGLGLRISVRIDPAIP